MRKSWAFLATVLVVAFSGVVLADDPPSELTEPHEGHDTWWCIQNYAFPIDSNVTPTLEQLVWQQTEWNYTAQGVQWQISDEVQTTHSWSVGACAEATLRNGMLTKVIADGKVSVEVEGEYSGAKTKTRTVSLSTTIPACRGKKREEYLDKYDCSASQDWYEWLLLC